MQLLGVVFYICHLTQVCCTNLLHLYQIVVVFAMSYTYNGATLVAQLVKNPPEIQPGSIPGLGRSSEKEIGYPLQYSWAFLVAQSVKNPPAMKKTWV